MKVVSHERDGAVVKTKADDLTFEEMQARAASLSFGSIKIGTDWVIGVELIIIFKQHYFTNVP